MSSSGNPKTHRRLAAILAADVVGYSSLMGKDEEGTLALLKSLRREVIEPRVLDHRGRVFKTMGDGFLAEFPSPVGALQCAVEIQEALSSPLSEDRVQRLQLRIGINLGDIIIEEDGDIFGDGVNIAARLEQMAEPGSIYISGKVFEEVRDKVPYPFEDRGEHQVKNIARPVRAYYLSVPLQAGSAPPVRSTYPLPDKPSIAVLPFTNLSGDPDQEYFADGLTEEIITALSYWRWFPVIARNSTFAYKGQPKSAIEIGQELGAAYLVEGSVRRSAGRVRVGVQLVDARTGHELWADRYDREIHDIFALQDEITERVVGSVEPELQDAEQRRISRKPIESLDAWDLALRGLALQQRMSRRGHDEARAILEKSLSIEHSSFAWSLLALCHYHEAILGWTNDRKAAFEASLRAAERAIELERRDWLAFALRGMGHLWTQRDFDTALKDVEEAVSLNPSAPITRHFLGCILEFTAKPQQAIPHLQAIHRLDPRYQFASLAIADEALCHLLMNELEPALSLVQQAIRMAPANVRARQRLCAILAALGRTADAQEEMRELLRLQPDLGVSYIDATYPFRDTDDRDGFIRALRTAGLPD